MVRSIVAAALVIILASCLVPLAALSLKIGDNNNIAIHRVPLRYNEPSAPFCYAVSSPSDLINSPSSSSNPNFLATQVWPSARVAAQCLIQFMDPSWSVCEFGCGPGLPSLTAASLGSPLVHATDLDTLALELVQSAALEQNWKERIQTSVFDLTRRNVDEQDGPPQADLYLLSDVFESAKVAEGAAHTVDRLLSSREGCRVWVFAQSDRSQREFFLEKLREIQGNDPTLAWVPYKEGEGPQQSLWLCSIDETTVSYG